MCFCHSDSGNIPISTGSGSSFVRCCISVLWRPYRRARVSLGLGPSPPAPVPISMWFKLYVASLHAPGVPRRGLMTRAKPPWGAPSGAASGSGRVGFAPSPRAGQGRRWPAAGRRARGSGSRLSGSRPPPGGRGHAETRRPQPAPLGPCSLAALLGLPPWGAGPIARRMFKRHNRPRQSPLFLPTPPPAAGK